MNDYLSNKLTEFRVKCKCNGLDPFCKCNELIRFEIKKLQAGIPIKYCNFTFDDITNPYVKKQKEVICEYIKDLEKNKRNGIGLFLYGKKGLGRTIFGYLVLLEALKKDYSCRFTTLEETLSELLNDNTCEMRQKLYETDFLMLDSLGKELRPASGITSTWLDTLLRKRGDNLFPTIITSSKDVNELSNYFSLDLESYFKEHMLCIKFEGVDYRQLK